MSKDILLLKGLIVGHDAETYRDYALMPELNDRFILVHDLVVGAKIYGLYRFVEQPEHCTHVSCGFDGKKEGNRLIKPKCTYISYRRLTKEEISKPDMSSLFIALGVSFLDEMSLEHGLAVYDTVNDKFVDRWFQDGGNERLVVEPGHTHGAAKILTKKTNYLDLVENMKRKAL